MGKSGIPTDFCLRFGAVRQILDSPFLFVLLIGNFSEYAISRRAEKRVRQPRPRLVRSGRPLLPFMRPPPARHVPDKSGPASIPFRPSSAVSRPVFAPCRSGRTIRFVLPRRLSDPVLRRLSLRSNRTSVLFPSCFVLLRPKRGKTRYSRDTRRSAPRCGRSSPRPPAANGRYRRYRRQSSAPPPGPVFASSPPVRTPAPRLRIYPSTPFPGPLVPPPPPCRPLLPAQHSAPSRSVYPILFHPRFADRSGSLPPYSRKPHPVPDFRHRVRHPLRRILRSGFLHPHSRFELPVSRSRLHSCKPRGKRLDENPLPPSGEPAAVDRFPDRQSTGTFTVQYYV